MSPRELLMGHPMNLLIDWEARTGELDGLPAKERLNREEAQQVVKTIQDYTETARKIAGMAQERMERAVNQHRRIPDFGPGDKVYILKRTGQASDRPSDKLDFPMTRQPYEIEKIEGHSYILKMPASWKGSRKFPADRLRKYPDNPLPGQEPEQPAGEVVNPDLPDEVEYVVNKILASKVTYNKLRYRAEWVGHPDDPEWYIASNFKNSADKLKAFHEENPQAPGPPKRLQNWLDAANKEEFDKDHEDDDKAENRQEVHSGTRQRFHPVRGK